MCFISTGQNDYRFVGIKADIEGIRVYFPIGWHLSDDEKILREDILTLLKVLSDFMKKDKLISAQSLNPPKNVDFPLHAYLKIIKNFLNNGKYYVETDTKYKVGAVGQISWSRTIQNQKGFVKGGNLIFTDTVARHLNTNFNKQITQIHKFCVYEAFDKLGWLYTVHKPEFPGQHPSVGKSIQILNKKISHSHNDKEQELFRAMINILKYTDAENSDRNYLFGTNYFERVWEGIIDRAFGVENKSKYFPKTRWLLELSEEKKSLFPDSIMIYRDKFYVLDAKYYKYGQTGKFYDLPGSADINKQITYGEYIAHTLKISNERLFNAFILPYDMKNNKFGMKFLFVNFGEAVGDWKENVHYYERVQGIVIDTRFLMYNYLTISKTYKNELATCIEQVFKRNFIS